MNAPTPFRAITRRRKTALVRTEWADTIAGALLDNDGCTEVRGEGRGALLRFRYENGWGVIRKYYRGGIVRHVLKDAYILHNRPARELRLHHYLFEQGLSVPMPLGACWERRGPCFRGAIATHQLEAPSLLERLRATPGSLDRTLRQCGCVIRQMHGLGVFHRDLQVRNILAGDNAVYLIDFDNARLRRNVPPLHRARNLLRLRRSFEKNHLPDDHFLLLCDGYGDTPIPRWLSRLYQLKGASSDLIFGHV